MNFKVMGLSDKEHIILTESSLEDVKYVELKLTANEKMKISHFKLKFSFPILDCYSTWSPSLGMRRNLMPNWAKQSTNSRLASWMPVHELLSIKGKNRLCIAVSDVKTPIRIATGVNEENACFDCVIEFFTIPTSPLKEYHATIRLDMRDIDFFDSLYDVSAWWENYYTPAFVPETAKMPMNSLWYSFHQNLNSDEIIHQCTLSKPLGMDSVIIDDGWQTDNIERGYAYCGDWQICDSKIPDMKKLVEDIHKTGMNVILWYSVPFVGIYSKAYDRFKDMLLESEHNNTYVLDPRYKEVRDYLCGIYENAMKMWGLDGFKLDFIDSFALKEKDFKPDDRRDYESLEDAVDVLMKEINRRLRVINPDVLIEFRQSYIGPAIRSYGNMLRVADCPNDSVVNRISIVDMRLTSGTTPVHSDMIMWNYDESVESASLQIANILYSVPQISMLIDRLSEEHYKMLQYYLNFWREHREVLLSGKVTAECPESLYSQVCSELEGKKVITVYTDRVITKLNDYNVIVNASPFNSLFVKDAGGKKCTVVNCMGEELHNYMIKSSIEEIFVPIGGMIFLK